MKYTGGPMTEAMYYVLLTLMNPSHGYGLMNEIKEVSSGRIEMGPGTLYGVCVTKLGEFNVLSSPVQLNAPELHTDPAEQSHTLNLPLKEKA